MELLLFAFPDPLFFLLHLVLTPGANSEWIILTGFFALLISGGFSMWDLAGMRKREKLRFAVYFSKIPPCRFV